MGCLSWIVIGLLAGILARWLIPGRGRDGILRMLGVGIVGAVLGGLTATALRFGGLLEVGLESLVTAALGSILLLFVYRIVRK